MSVADSIVRATVVAFVIVVELIFFHYVFPASMEWPNILILAVACVVGWATGQYHFDQMRNS